jgi:hypothetical protein
MDEDPDQTAKELIEAIMSRFPSKYTTAHLRTLQRRLRVWRRDSVQRLIMAMEETFTRPIWTPTVTF